VCIVMCLLRVRQELGEGADAEWFRRTRRRQIFWFQGRANLPQPLTIPKLNRQDTQPSTC